MEIVWSFREQCLHANSLRKLKADLKNEGNNTENAESYLNVELKEESDDQGNDLRDRSDSELENVDKNKTTSVLYKCKRCEQRFEQRFHLTKHNKLVHHSEKPYECLICDKAFKSTSHLNRHERAHLTQLKNSSDSFVCYHCNNEFDNKISLSQHVRRDHKFRQGSKKCSRCDKSYSSQQRLDMHTKREHGIDIKSSYKKKEFECTKCGKLYTTLKVMKAHAVSCDGIKRHVKNKRRGEENASESESTGDDDSSDETWPPRTAKNKYKNNTDADLNEPCPICGKKFNSTQSVNVHIIKMHNKTGNEHVPKENSAENPSFVSEYSCELCSDSFPNRDNFQEHVVQIHGEDPELLKPFKCGWCTKRYVHSESLWNHVRNHPNLRRFICSFCGKGFKEKGHLQVHEQIHWNKRSFRCELCDKGFNTPKNLRTHCLLKHRDPSTWNYHCRICDHRFLMKSSYNSHMRRHMGDKPFACHLCGKAFVTKNEMLIHINSHTNVRAYKCEHCDQEYKHKKTMEMHLKKVHNLGDAKVPIRVRKHLCTMCPKAFYDKNKLTRHTYSHTGERPFSCHVCDKKFTDKSYVKQHLKSAHNIGETNNY